MCKKEWCTVFWSTYINEHALILYISIQHTQTTQYAHKDIRTDILIHINTNYVMIASYMWVGVSNTKMLVSSLSISISVSISRSPSLSLPSLALLC